ncbi:TetR/AcrR family transcriptional regulator [Actinoplanes sp. TBRC 11911]|uniref:TetR/AcrR family transcriptional regulator n=1 Tax=Actinoplanes sp. TBRC 11911 TaxID=2729386 RepID=UPI00145FA8B5|nr:TetR/AcrR family transcriptional regulator [Actinoplanes sp. TBRC 11911]NMO56239.1 TetR/AcrR family transcriptional regulator [Actinoplanes sp. TBRC 11911]
MTASEDKRRLTAKGQATRLRIVDAASGLMLEHGVTRTTLEDIQRAAAVSPSQLYHYFRDKDELVLAVVDRLTEIVLDVQHMGLDRMDSLAALRRWRDLVVDLTRQAECVGGCPLGSLASNLAEPNPIARARLAQSFAQWEKLLVAGLAAMQATGELRADADPEELGLALLAAAQGGLLLSQVRRDTKALETALDTAINYIETQTTPAGS